MKRLRILILAGVVGATLVPASSEARTTTRAPRCDTQNATIFAGGGSPMSNGVFFPGAAVYDGRQFIGSAQVVDRGCNVEFVNLDAGAVANAHSMVSFKRKRGRPLFYSRSIMGPGTAMVRTSHLRPGTYPFYCSVHHGMFGLLEVKNI